jgi:UDP-N-acetylmuramoylalanine--D-glutamate ligase
LRRGEIERENVEAAYLLSARFGVSRGAFDRALQTFQKPPHRITYVGEIGGVEFYNDSKGTNVDAVIYALKRFPGPVILLVGGVDKGASYAPWLDHFPGKVKRVLAYGAAREKIARELSRSSLSVSVVETLREAFERACGAAQTGDQILLSPGCASYDQFRNFEHRGEEFTRMVQERIEEKV